MTHKRPRLVEKIKLVHEEMDSDADEFDVAMREEAAYVHRLNCCTEVLFGNSPAIDLLQRRTYFGEVSVSRMGYTYQEGKAIARIVKTHRNFKRLSIAWTGLFPYCLESSSLIARALRRRGTTLRFLEIANYSADTESLQDIVRALIVNKSVVWLKLRDESNGMFHAICDVVEQNRTLTSLDLSECRFTHNLWIDFCHAMSTNTSIENLSIPGRQIDQTALINDRENWALHMLSENKTLRCLDITQDAIAFTTGFDKAIHSNKSLTHLSIAVLPASKYLDDDSWGEDGTDYDEMHMLQYLIQFNTTIVYMKLEQCRCDNYIRNRLELMKKIRAHKSGFDSNFRGGAYRVDWEIIITKLIQRNIDMAQKREEYVTLLTCLPKSAVRLANHIQPNLTDFFVAMVRHSIPVRKDNTKDKDAVFLEADGSDSFESGGMSDIPDGDDDDGDDGEEVVPEQQPLQMEQG